jgi:hypothetical protein
MAGAHHALQPVPPPPPPTPVSRTNPANLPAPRVTMRTLTPLSLSLSLSLYHQGMSGCVLGKVTWSFRWQRCTDRRR